MWFPERPLDIDACFVLQETIKSYKESNAGSCIAFLDSYKAFDSVWHTGLLYKLSEIEIPLKYGLYCTGYITKPNHVFL